MQLKRTALIGIVVAATLTAWIIAKRSSVAFPTKPESADDSTIPADSKVAGPSATSATNQSARSAAQIPNEEHTHSRSLADYLSEYWGDQWPEYKKRLEEWCYLTGQVDCLAQTVEAVPKPWAAIEAQMQDEVLSNAAHTEAARDTLIAWPNESITIQDIKDRFKLPNGVELEQNHLAVVEGIAAKYDAELRFRAEAWQKGVSDVVAAMWFSGNYEKGPLMLPPYQGEAMYSLTITHEGWCVNLVLKAGEYPWLNEDVSQLNALKMARAQEIQAYLNSLH